MKTYQRGKDNNDLMSMPIEVGGRNLLIDSAKIKTLGKERIFENQKYYDIPYNYWQNSYTVDIIAGQTYTISVPVYNDNETPLVSRITIGGAAYSISVAGKTCVIHTKTITAIQTTIGARIYILTDSNSGNLSLSFGKAKFEKGNIPTGWTPAPEDIEARLKALEQKVGL